ncbi:minor tail protein [Mycobacterium phage Jolie2]|uniref:Minor tail protein n=1 Tax=Mycobacterium phage Jolie2 TaxID=1458831 RepID=W8EGS1_9CAUD|nr:minor tail protein [Mycobacterium phage Jolie2]AHJ86571.1 hypothetical protein Jolie2_21 [Mycobacterium phage Jolie2]
MSTPAPLAADPSKEYTKRYKTVVPIPLPADTVRPATIDDVTPEAGHPDFVLARWLGRESFENTAEGDRLTIVEYHERIVPLDELDPRLIEHVGPLDRFVWFEFSGVGRLDVDAFNWFAAEFVWNCDEWLAAERAWLEAGGDDEDQDEGE